MDNKISIIVPVYNVEQYVKECIESLLKINLPKEIIVVNDGSKDGSMEIVQKMQVSNKDVIFIYNKENGGLSSARNHGLDQATGDIISFIDSDDWVDPIAFEKMYHEMIFCDLDMIQGFLLWVEDLSKTIVSKVSKKDMYVQEIVSGKEFIKYKHRSETCVYFYKKKYLDIHKFRFVEGIIHEDEIFTIEALYKTEKIKAIDVDFYYYRQREGSIMNSDQGEKRMFCYFYLAYSWSIIFGFNDVYDKRITNFFRTSVSINKAFDLRVFIRVLLWNTRSFTNFKKMIKCFLLVFNKDIRLVNSLKKIKLLRK
jgi:glycosyltransferase involved in cell wall biosynthesis